MLTDYKTPRQTQHNDGSWSVRLRVYEGNVTTENDYVEEDGVGVPVTRYRRTTVLQDVVLNFPAMPEQALIGLLNAELAKDQTRTAIPEQRNAS